MKILFSLVAFALCLSVARGQGSNLTFKNPILDRNSADPGIFKLGDFYYLTLSERNETALTVFQSPILTSFRNATSNVAYTTKDGQINLWASEMHMMDDGLYIYFTMEIPSQNIPHLMYVVKADDPTNPMGTWGEATRLMPNWPYWAIDASILKHGNGKNYFVWSSTGFLDNQNALWIAEMYSATNISSTTAIIRQPRYVWENRVDEGPYFIYRNNISFLVYSAASTFHTSYCLGLMSIPGDKDPMEPDNWWFGGDEPVFSNNEEESVYTTGHATFTVSPDGTETWMVYHAVSNPEQILGYRIARLEKIDWDASGMPVFPKPHGYNHSMPVPSGQTVVY